MTPRQTERNAIVPRHQPGHRSRVRDLDRRIRSSVAVDGTPAIDPFCGNYTLVSLQDIVVAYPGLKETVTLQAFPVASAGTQSPPRVDAITEGASQTWPLSPSDSASRPLALCVDDFNGDGVDEAAIAFFSGNTLNLDVQSYNETSGTFASKLTSPVVALSPTQQGAVRMTSGVFASGGTSAPSIAQGSQLALAVAEGAQLNLALWNLAGTAPSSIASDSSISLTGAFDLAAGDFDGDGHDELVVAYQGAADGKGNNLYVRIYSLSTSGGTPALAVLGTTTVGTANSGSVSVRCGNLMPDSPSTGQTIDVDQIVVGWGAPNSASETAGTPSVAVLKFSGDTAAFSVGQLWQDASTYPLVNNAILRVAVGDVNMDGVDEIILGTEGSYPDCTTPSSQKDVLILRCFQVDGALDLNLTSTGTAGSQPGYSLVYSDLSLAIGAPSPSGSNEAMLSAITVGCVGFDSMTNVLQGIGMVTVGVVQMTGGLAFPSALTEGLATFAANNTDDLPVVSFPAQGPKLAIDLAVGLGDFAGRSIRVGVPSYFRADAVNGVLAIINSLPFDLRAISDAAPSISFQTSTSQQLQISLSLNNDWTTSDTLNANLGVGSLGSINGSITNSYGAGFNQSTIAMQGAMVLMSDSVDNDDAICFSITDYDVWEYPVFNSAANTPLGHILVIFPDVPGQPETLWTNTSALNSYYAPQHNPMNLLSYWQTPNFPPDFRNENALYSGQAATVAPGSEANVMVQYNSMSTQTVGASSRVGLHVTKGADTSQSINPEFLPGLKGGLSLSVADAYNTSNTSTHNISYMEQNSIQIMFGRTIDTSVEYQITPLIYWSVYGQPINYPVVTITGLPTGGTFNVTVGTATGTQTTQPIAFNADLTSVQSALEALTNVGIGNVAVGGIAGQTYSLVFQGALAAAQTPDVSANGSGLTGGSQPSAVVSVFQTSAASSEQVVTVSGSPTGGSFYLTLTIPPGGPQSTAPILWNASALDVQNAVAALVAPVTGSGVTVTGTAGGPYCLTFGGTLAAASLPAMTADGSALTGGSSPAVSVQMTVLGKYLVVDSVVTLIPGTYWTNDTLTPVPAFNCPWAQSSDPTFHLLSRAINAVPQQDGTVHVSATVSNYSMATAEGYFAQFYVGAPEGGTPIGALVAVPSIAPAGSIVVAAVWTPPIAGAAYPLFCEVSDGAGNPLAVAFNMYPPGYFNSLLPASNVVQVVTVTPSSTVPPSTDPATFSLSLQLPGGEQETTAAIAQTAAASDVQAALQALANVGAGNVEVAGAAGGPFTVTFIEQLANPAVTIPLLVPSGAAVV